MTAGRRLIALLLLAAAVLFASGVTLEQRTVAAGEEHPEREADGEHGEGPTAEESSPERVAGMNLESPWLIMVGVLLSAALGAAVWRSGRAAALWAAGLFAFGFAVLDGFEFVHQLSEGSRRLVVLALVVAGLHLAVAVIAVIEIERTPSDA